MSEEYFWLPLEKEKRGLILHRLRLKGGFNLVDRMWRDSSEKPYQQSVFLEGKIDTDLGLDWEEDFDVRKRVPNKNSKTVLTQHKVT